jgi:hypothetical protein
MICIPYDCDFPDMESVSYSPYVVWDPWPPAWDNPFSFPGTYYYDAWVYGEPPSDLCGWIGPVYVGTFFVDVLGIGDLDADEEVICAGGSTGVYAYPDPWDADFPSGSPTWSVSYDPPCYGCSFNAGPGDAWGTFTASLGYGGVVTITAGCGDSSKSINITVVKVTSINAPCERVGARSKVGLSASTLPLGRTVIWSMEGQEHGCSVASSGSLTAGGENAYVIVKACDSGLTDCCFERTFEVVGACEPPSSPVATPILGADDTGWACHCDFNPDVFACLFFESVEFCPIACYRATDDAWHFETTCLNVHYSQRICASSSQTCAQQGLNAGVSEILNVTVLAWNALTNQVTLTFDCGHSTEASALAAMGGEISAMEVRLYNAAANLWVVAPLGPVDIQDPVPTTAMSAAYQNCLNGN